MSFNPYNKSKDGDIISILILFIRKMRPREAKYFAQIHLSNNWWNQRYAFRLCNARPGTLT